MLFFPGALWGNDGCMTKIAKIHKAQKILFALALADRNFFGLQVRYN